MPPSPPHPLSPVLTATLAWLAFVRQDTTLALRWQEAQPLLRHALEARRFVHGLAADPAASAAWTRWVGASLAYVARAGGLGVCPHPLGLVRVLSAADLARLAERSGLRGLTPLYRSLALAEGETVGEALERGLRTVGPAAEGLLLSHGLLSVVSTGFAERELGRCLPREARAEEVACG